MRTIVLFILDKKYVSKIFLGRALALAVFTGSSFFVLFSEHPLPNLYVLFKVA